MSRALAPFLLALLALHAAPRAADGGADPVSGSIQALGDPAEGKRRRAVEALVAALPASRASVIEALADAPPEVQVHLIEVLGRDGSPPAIRALLGALRRADPLQASRIRYALVRHPVASGRVLEAWTEDPSLRADEGDTITPAVAALETLLRRAEAERLFLSRKSRSGGTGSYHGQYDVLLPYREEALDLCVGILLDRALEEPGIFTTGRFEFLRTPDRAIDMDELTGMASHAFAELGRETDLTHLQALTVKLPSLRRRADDLNGMRSFEFLEAVARYADIVIALYRVRPSHYRVFVDHLLRELRLGGDWFSAISASQRAGILLRTGRFEDAIREFELMLSIPDPVGLRSSSLTQYNMACAYAQWSEHLEGKEREHRRTLALHYLERSVREGWSDVGWLDEDRDLDPIRTTERFRELREAMIAANTPPEDD